MASVGPKNARKCYTCRYWMGCNVKVKSVAFVEYNSSEQATCNKTGFKKPAWASCKEHEKRIDF